MTCSAEAAEGAAQLEINTRVAPMSGSHTCCYCGRLCRHVERMRGAVLGALASRAARVEIPAAEAARCMRTPRHSVLTARVNFFFCPGLGRVAESMGQAWLLQRCYKHVS